MPRGGGLVRGRSRASSLPPALPPVQYNADKAIVDSGTTLLRLPLKVFDAVVDGVARASPVSLARARGDLGGRWVMTPCWAVVPSVLIASLGGF